MLALAVLGACSQPSTTTVAASAIADEQPPPAVEPPVKFDAAPEEVEEVDEPSGTSRAAAEENRFRLLAISGDGRRALLGVLEPAGRAPELRSVEIATNRVVARAELMAVAALPRRSSPGKDFDADLDRALRGNRLLAEDLANLGPVLAGFPLGAGGGYAAIDAMAVAYVVDRHLNLLRGGDPTAARIADARDPWIAPDRATLIYTGEGNLYTMPFAGGAPTKIAGAERLSRDAVVVRSPTVLRALEYAPPRTACVADIALDKHRVERRTCAPVACANCAVATPSLSPDGGWLAWLEVEESGNARKRAMNLATRAITVDAPVRNPAGQPLAVAVSDTGRVHVGRDELLRDCRFRGDDLVCVRGNGVAIASP